MNKNILFYLGLFHLSLGKFCYDKANQELKCENFTNFDELKLENYNQTIKKLSLNPSEKIDFDYRAAFQLDQITKKIQNNSEIILNKLLSLDVSINDFFLWNSDSIFIDESEIDFLINNQSLECDIRRSSVAKFFRNFKIIQFGPNVEFIKNELCPIIFYRINLNKLEFSHLKSEFKFSQFVNDESLSLQSNIKHLVIKNSELKDLKILDKAIFGDLESITYSSNSTTSFFIDNEFFQSFNKIRYFSISLEYFSDFFYKTKLKWLQNTDSTEIELILEDYSGSYVYPDEDFCIFFDSLDKKKNISTTINTNETAECSCTLAYLFSLTKDEKKFSTNIKKCDKIKQLSKNCSLQEKIRECLPSTTTVTTNVITLPVITDPKKDVWSIIFAAFGLISLILVLPFIGYFIYHQRQKSFRKKYPHENTDVNIF